jgi:hypothetical protein
VWKVFFLQAGCFFLFLKAGLLFLLLQTGMTCKLLQARMHAGTVGRVLEEIIQSFEVLKTLQLY